MLIRYLFSCLCDSSKDFFLHFESYLSASYNIIKIYFRTHVVQTLVARKICVNLLPVVKLDLHSTVNVPRTEPMEKCARKVYCSLQ